MMAAITAAQNGHQVSVYEKNDKLGKKLFITGKGRCNITNACDIETLFTNVVTNAKFLYSSFYGFSNYDVIDFFEKLGIRTKIERGERVFPVSDHSSDVIRALSQEMNRLNVRVQLNCKVKDVVADGGRFSHLILNTGERVTGAACIVATGGCSYRSTGSTGDGYIFAERTGHKTREAQPSLVPMEVAEEWIKDLQGLSLRNIKIYIYHGNRELYQEFGEMLFTHYGVSGPVVLSASAVAGDKIVRGKTKLVIDLKPALSAEQLDLRVLRDFDENRNKSFKNALGRLFPTRLIPVMVKCSGIDGEKKVHEISREERQNFVRLIKNFTMTVTALRDFNEAIITKGGVDVKEVNPSTMESKRVQGLYFAGEVLDVDARTGGFNLQIAWSTGYAAGNDVK